MKRLIVSIIAWSIVAISVSLWIGFHFGQYTCKLNYQATRVFV